MRNPSPVLYHAKVDTCTQSLSRGVEVECGGYIVMVAIVSIYIVQVPRLGSNLKKIWSVSISSGMLEGCKQIGPGVNGDW